MTTIDHVLNRLRAEFLEMPGMRLTREQVQRLCGLEAEPCRAMLDSLVKANFLRLSKNGQYTRVTDGGMRRKPRSHAVAMAGADLNQ